PSMTGGLHKAVAVLPFRNAGPAEDEYLADGLTEDLIDTLSMNRMLRGGSRGAVMRLRGVGRDPRELGKELGVHVVAHGTVRRTGAAVRRAAAHLGEARERSRRVPALAKRFDRPAADVLAVGDEAAAAIAEALAVDWHAPPRAPTDPAALDLFLRARHEATKR